jgi:hypothetical protein
MSWCRHLGPVRRGVVVLLLLGLATAVAAHVTGHGDPEVTVDSPTEGNEVPPKLRRRQEPTVTAPSVPVNEDAKRPCGSSDSEEKAGTCSSDRDAARGPSAETTMESAPTIDDALRRALMQAMHASKLGSVEERRYSPEPSGSSAAASVPQVRPEEVRPLRVPVVADVRYPYPMSDRFAHLRRAPPSSEDSDASDTSSIDALLRSNLKSDDTPSLHPDPERAAEFRSRGAPLPLDHEEFAMIRDITAPLLERMAGLSEHTPLRLLQWIAPVFTSSIGQTHQFVASFRPWDAQLLRFLDAVNGSSGSQLHAGAAASTRDVYPETFDDLLDPVGPRALHAAHWLRGTDADASCGVADGDDDASSQRSEEEAAAAELAGHREAEKFMRNRAAHAEKAVGVPYTPNAALYSIDCGPFSPNVAPCQPAVSSGSDSPSVVAIRSLPNAGQTYVGGTYDRRLVPAPRASDFTRLSARAPTDSVLIRTWLQFRAHVGLHEEVAVLYIPKGLPAPRGKPSGGETSTTTQPASLSEWLIEAGGARRIDDALQAHGFDLPFRVVDEEALDEDASKSSGGGSTPPFEGPSGWRLPASKYAIPSRTPFPTAGAKASTGAAASDVRFPEAATGAAAATQGRQFHGAAPPSASSNVPMPRCERGEAFLAIYRKREHVKLIEEGDPINVDAVALQQRMAGRELEATALPLLEIELAPVCIRVQFAQAEKVAPPDLGAAAADATNGDAAAAAFAKAMMGQLAERQRFATRVQRVVDAAATWLVRASDPLIEELRTPYVLTTPYFEQSARPQNTDYERFGWRAFPADGEPDGVEVTIVSLAQGLAQDKSDPIAYLQPEDDGLRVLRHAAFALRRAQPAGSLGASSSARVNCFYFDEEAFPQPYAEMASWPLLPQVRSGPDTHTGPDESVNGDDDELLDFAIITTAPRARQDPRAAQEPLMTTRHRVQARDYTDLVRAVAKSLERPRSLRRWRTVSITTGADDGALGNASRRLQIHVAELERLRGGAAGDPTAQAWNRVMHGVRREATPFLFVVLGESEMCGVCTAVRAHVVPELVAARLGLAHAPTDGRMKRDVRVVPLRGPSRRAMTADPPADAITQPGEDGSIPPAALGEHWRSSLLRALPIDAHPAFVAVNHTHVTIWNWRASSLSPTTRDILEFAQAAGFVPRSPPPAAEQRSRPAAVANIKKRFRRGIQDE